MLLVVFNEGYYQYMMFFYHGSLESLESLGNEKVITFDQAQRCHFDSPFDLSGHLSTRDLTWKWDEMGQRLLAELNAQ